MHSREHAAARVRNRGTGERLDHDTHETTRKGRENEGLLLESTFVFLSCGFVAFLAQAFPLLQQLGSSDQG